MFTQLFERIFGATVWQMIQHLDLLSMIILIILLTLSLVCWAIFLYKWVVLQGKQRQVSRAIKQLKQVGGTGHDLTQLAVEFKHTYVEYFISNLHAPILSSAQREAVCKQREYAIDETLQYDEQYVVVILISSQIAPLLGLLGTIWGLIQAFINMSQQQSADILVIAPGLAQALIVTLAGLLVAIPAHAMYHVLANKIRDLEHQLSVLVQRCNTIVMHIPV